MRLEHADPSEPKGWYVGPWNAELAVSIGYANQGIDEPHLHLRMAEVYLIARGASRIRVNDDVVTLAAGDVLILDPGEPHTFVSSSPDYFHFVLHTPALPPNEATADRVAIDRLTFRPIHIASKLGDAYERAWQDWQESDDATLWDATIADGLAPPAVPLPPMPSTPNDDLRQLGADMVAAAYLKGDFVLRSGRHSNYYFDKYLFETQPAILRRLGRHLAALVPRDTQLLAAPELGAVLLGGAVSMELDLPLVLIRKGAKEYGTSKLIEGRLEPGQRVTVIEDVLTTGGEAIRAAETVRAAGGEVLRLIAVVDREEGAEAALAAAGLAYTPLFRNSDLTLPI